MRVQYHFFMMIFQWIVVNLSWFFQNSKITIRFRNKQYQIIWFVCNVVGDVVTFVFQVNVILSFYWLIIPDKHCSLIMSIIKLEVRSNNWDMILSFDINKQWSTLISRVIKELWVNYQQLHIFLINNSSLIFCLIVTKHWIYNLHILIGVFFFNCIDNSSIITFNSKESWICNKYKRV